MSELQFHPLAGLFPLMEGTEFEELVADIKAHGLRERIDLYQGKIADGRNRYRALQQLGIDPSTDQKKYFRKALYAHSAGGEIAPHEQNNDDRVRALIISRNIHRRHLTAEQKREIIAKVIAAKPEASDRQIAKQVKADHKTVGAVRKAKEATGEVSPVEKRVGTDGKVRKQPAKPVNGLNAIGKPFSPQYDPSYKMRQRAPVKTPDRGRGDVAEDMLDILSGLNKDRRTDFFRALWDKFRDELIEAQTAKMAAVDDGLDIPDSLRREPKAAAS
jgi:hypothetical protein